MRFMPAAAAASIIALTIAGGPVLVATSTTAEAQERPRTRITITPRHYLDAGTTVKPGTARYHNYVLPQNHYYPNYGHDLTGASRVPLPRQFWLPGY